MSDYRELQKRAKELGVKAVGTTEELRERIENAVDEPKIRQRGLEKDISSKSKGREEVYSFPNEKISIVASSLKEAVNKLREGVK